MASRFRAGTFLSAPHGSGPCSEHEQPPGSPFCTPNLFLLLEAQYGPRVVPQALYHLCSLTTPEFPGHDLPFCGPQCVPGTRVFHGSWGESLLPAQLPAGRASSPECSHLLSSSTAFMKTLPSCACLSICLSVHLSIYYLYIYQSICVCEE